jgi:hypothetical protein
MNRGLTGPEDILRISADGKRRVAPCRPLIEHFSESHHHIGGRLRGKPLEHEKIRKIIEKSQMKHLPGTLCDEDNVCMGHESGVQL